MTQEVKDINVTETNHASEKVGNGGFMSSFQSTELAELIYEFFGKRKYVYDPLKELEDYVLAFKDKEFLEISDRLQSLLYEMRHAKFIVIGVIDKIKHLLLRFITLIYGLCSSHTSIIFRSFFSSSLFRTPLVLN